MKNETRPSLESWPLISLCFPGVAVYQCWNPREGLYSFWLIAVKPVGCGSIGIVCTQHSQPVGSFVLIKGCLTANVPLWLILLYWLTIACINRNGVKIVRPNDAWYYILVHDVSVHIWSTWACYTCQVGVLVSCLSVDVERSPKFAPRLNKLAPFTGDSRWPLLVGVKDKREPTQCWIASWRVITFSTLHGRWVLVWFIAKKVV